MKIQIFVKICLNYYQEYYLYVQEKYLNKIFKLTLDKIENKNSL
jgi:hypothetical protein